MPYVSHEKLIEDNKPEYYVALRTSQKTFIRDHAPDFNPHKKETIEPWLTFFFSVLEKQAEEAVELLSKETRLQILYLLKMRNFICVGDISGILRLDISAVSHQLQLLRKERLVTFRKKGKVVYYSLNQSLPKIVEEVLNSAMNSQS